MDPYSPDSASEPVLAAVAIAPAWEDRSRPLLSRWWATVVAVLRRPYEFFGVMRHEGGLGAPLVFALVGGWIGVAASEVQRYLTDFLSWREMIRFGDATATDHVPQWGDKGWEIALAPVYLVFVLFVGSALLHLCLMPMGGVKRPFGATFRVVAYVGGSFRLLNLVPFCGMFMAIIWGISAKVAGVSRIRQISTGRALVAVSVSGIATIVCCIVGFFWMLSALSALHVWH